MLTAPFIHVRGLTKGYGALRPLRVEELTVGRGETVVVKGMDEAAAAVLVDLVTGTTLPDAGEVSVAGMATSSLGDHEAWLAFLEQFGIVNPRVVLLDELTLLQNLAVPLTLDVDPLPAEARSRALQLASLVGLAGDLVETSLAGASALTRLRVRLGRAVAHNPSGLLVEHPTLALGPRDVDSAAEALLAIAREAERGVLIVSNDDRLAGKVATKRLTWSPASGRMTPLRRRLGWMGKG